MESPSKSTLKTPENGDGTSSLPPPTKNISKINKPNKNSKIDKSKELNQYITKTVKVKEKFLNITSTNAADLKHKSKDLKNKIKFFNSGIFAVQETHYRKKRT